jgi:AcrR family transcriptional regulator
MESERSILDATIKILRKDGYAGLTLDKVAALAKSSKATIYRRWPAKEHLVFAVLDRLPPLEPVDSGNLLDELLQMHAKAARTVEADSMREILAMLPGEAAVNPELRNSMRLFEEKRRNPMRIVLDRAISRGELPRGADVELAIDFIQGSMMIRGYLLGQPLYPDWMSAMLKTLIRGLGGKIK